MADNTVKKQRAGKPFKKGTSGNPSGRPKGSLNKTTMALREMINGEAEQITRAVIDKAKGGDSFALKLLFERILPIRKDEPIKIDLPTIKSSSDLVNFCERVFQALGSGEITPIEAGSIMNMAETNLKVIETYAIEQRIAKLEQKFEAVK